MSYSKEKTYYYLTIEGWVTGDSKLDTGKLVKGENPKSYIAKYIYQEEFSSPFDKNPIMKADCLEVIDEELHKQLISKYGHCPKYIST